MMKIALILLAAVNLFTFFIYGIDKLKARKGGWRIPESKLMALAIFGGSIGALIGMSVWRHKTIHSKFKYGVPAILVLQIVGAFLLLR